MPSLILILENCERHAYPLGKTPVVIGRDDTANIQLQSENVSPHHASIVFENGCFVLHDNGSATGSHINGQPATQAILKRHDILRFGEYLFLFEPEDERSKTAGSQATRSKDGDSQTSGQPAAAEEAEPKKVAAPDRKRVKLSLGWLRSWLIGGLIMALPVVAFVSATFTLYLLPMVARETVLESDGFQKLPLQAFFRSVLSRDRPQYTAAVVLQQNAPPFSTIIMAPQPVHATGRLKFLKRISSPIRIKVRIGGKKAKTQPILEKMVDVPLEVTSYTLFSIELPPGKYEFEGKCEEGGEDVVGVQATFQIFIKD